MEFLTLVALAGVAGIGYFFFVTRAKQQLAFIENYEFHPSLRKKVSEKYPHLTEKQVSLVFDGLRTYFHICNKAKRKMVAMPSQVVDVAWHEFIVFTRAYEQFSKKAIGRFLHHTPTEAMSSPTVAHEGIKRAWRLSCAKENINPKTPTKLPLLFAIDTQLEIEGGFKYLLNCKDQTHVGSNGSSGGYCAGHIGCASGCGGDSGSASESTGSSCGGSSCGSGCGGGD